MRKLKILVTSILFGGFTYGQAPTGAPPTNPNNVNLTAKSAWYRGGNFPVGPAGNNNIFGTMAGFNSPIYTYTNGINRMTVFGGTATNADGRITMGNNLPAGFTPTARLHLFQNEVTTGLVTTTTKYSDNSTGTGINDGFEVGYSSSANIPFATYAQLRNRENTPMKFYTSNQERIHVNPNRTVTLDGYNVPTNGFVGIGNPSQGFVNPGLWDQRGPFSLLHLNGRTGFNSFVFAGGYRPWMRTGITFSDQIDISYIGLRSVYPAGNINEMVINLSNDPTTSFGPDDIVFRFTVAGNGNTTIDNDFNAYNDLDGRHLARFTGEGKFGLGPVFGVAQSNPNYVTPASLAHLSLINFNSVYTQYTNRETLVGSGTGETAADGLRIGIHGNTDQNINGTALMYNQENRPLLFSTNANTNTLNIANGATRERLRITAVNTPTNLVGGGVGVNNPGNTFGNFTRVGISLNPQTPVTRPLSLVHLGLNAPNNLGGWRNWMNVGTYTTNGNDNMYVGLKTEQGPLPGNDRQDAVINWGDNDDTNPGFGPDNLRFIFTTATTSPNNPVSASNNGLETMRIVPLQATTLTNNYGMMGIGDWTTAFNILPANVIDAKLDIDGDLRIRQVTEDTTLLQVLVIDSNDHNRVHWRSINSFALGNICGSGTNPLTTNWEIPQGVNVFNFSGKGTVNITNPSNCAPSSKFLVDDDLHAITSIVRNNTGTPGNIAGMFIGSSSSKVHALIVPFDGGNVGFGTTSPNPTYRLEVFGGSNFNGNIFQNGVLISSDQNLKTNIDTISSALTIINQLTPKTFFFDTTNVYGMNFSNKKQYGFIAQEVELILPELIENLTKDAVVDSFQNVISQAINYKTLNYNAFIAILMKGMQEQQSTIDSLIDAVETLTTCVTNANLCNTQSRTNNNENGEGQSVKLENLNAIILQQNLPNPFAESTQINYVIPADVLNAKILFYDMNGRIINC